MNKKTAWIACALMVVSGLSIASAQDGRRALDRQDRSARMERRLGAKQARAGRIQHRRQHGRELLRSLEITQVQKDHAREVARSLQPIVDSTRAQVRPLMQQARELARAGDRKAAREMIRTRVRPVVENAMESARPLVRPLVGTLSVEQRAKLEAAAAARGRKFDEERFTKRLTWRLARRGTAR